MSLAHLAVNSTHTGTGNWGESIGRNTFDACTAVRRVAHSNRSARPGRETQNVLLECTSVAVTMRGGNPYYLHSKLILKERKQRDHDDGKPRCDQCGQQVAQAFPPARWQCDIHVTPCDSSCNGFCLTRPKRCVAEKGAVQDVRGTQCRAPPRWPAATTACAERTDLVGADKRWT